MPHISRQLTARLLATGMVAAGLTAVHTTVAQAAWPGGDGLLVATATSGLIVANADGSDKHVYPAMNQVEDPSWSPNGQFLVYVSEGWTIAVSHPDGSDAVAIPQMGVDTAVGHPTFVNGGAGVVFSAATGGGQDAAQLYEAASDGSQAPVPLFPSATGYCDRDPSGTGGYIVFDRYAWTAADGCTGTPSVWIYDLATKSAQQLAADGSEPDLSSDGTKVVFVRQVDSWDQLFTVGADGSNVTQLTTNQQGVEGDGQQGYSDPVWSPTGTQIAYQSDNGDVVTEILNLSSMVSSVWADPADSPSWQPVTAQPTAAGTDLPIAYSQNTTGYGSGSVALDPGNGGATTQLTTNANGSVVWSPKGNRYIFGEGGLYAQAVGSANPDEVANAVFDSDTQVALDPEGSLLVFMSGNGLFYGATTDGSYRGYEFPIAGITPVGGETDSHPTVASNDAVVYQRTLNGQSDIYRETNGVTARYIANGMDPELSPDGSKVAFIRADSNGVNQVFTVAANGTSGLTQVTHDQTNDADPAWSPDGTQIAYSNYLNDMVYEVSATGGTVLGSIADASAPSFQPSATSHVVRVWGGNAIGTAIAASQYDWSAVGSTDSGRAAAKTVVLSRSDQFYDALTGSALATAKGGPLLITPPAALDAQVRAEIERILPKGSTVYLLGGTAALSPAVADAVTTAGYHVVRLAGSNEYGTAVAVDKAITAHPTEVMVATGVTYYDALSVGSAAGNDGAVLVLTDNGLIPQASAAYLDTINPNTVPYMAVGGPARTALQDDSYQTLKWGSYTFHFLVGNNAKDTALLVATNYYVASTDVAVATDNGWYDALSGGAMAGSRGGPLLLTDPGSLYGADATYLKSENFSLARIAMMGGPAALPAALQNPLGATLGAPWTYISFEPGSPEVPFTSLMGTHAPTAAVRDRRTSAAKQVVRR